MPAKRRNTPSKKGGAKKKKTDNETTTSPKKEKKTNNDDKPKSNLPSLAELYKLCVPEDPHKPPHEDQLLIWEERGALEQIVWPYLVQHHTKKTKDINWFHACHLLALLVTIHCREGTFPASTPLRFMQQEEEDNDTTGSVVLDKVLERLVYDDQKGFRFQTAVVHFVLVANTCHKGETIQVCNPGLSLWKWMPERRRELEFKKHPILQKKFDGLVKPTKTKKNSDEQRPFLVNLLSKIVHLLEGETDGHGKRLLRLQENANDNNQEENDNNDMEEDEAAPHVEKAESEQVWAFLHRGLELMIDLLSTHDTRQYLVVYMDSMHFSVRCRLAVGNRFANYGPLRLAQQLLQRINRLATLLPLESSVNVHTNTTIDNLKHLSPTPVDIVSLHHKRATTLQKICHRHYPHLKDVIYAGVGLLCNKHKSNNGAGQEGNVKYVRRVLGGLEEGQLAELLHRLRLADKASNEEVFEEHDDNFLWNVLLDYLTIPPHPLEQLKSFPLFPTESILWDHNLIPPTHFALRRSSPVLSLPKINKKFLSYQDYLLRNFELVRLESAYEIRSDLVDVIKRLRPIVRQSMDVDLQEDIVLKTEFRGWARMALELDDVVQIKSVDPPFLGDTLPSQVVAEFAIDLNACGDSIRREWDDLGEFDNLVLVTVDASKMTGQEAPLLRDYYLEQHQKPFSENDQDRRIPDGEDSTFPTRFGVTAVRGCTVVQIRDEKGTVLSEPGFRSSSEAASGTKRIFRVLLDSAQFVADRSSVGTEMYQVKWFCCTFLYFLPSFSFSMLSLRWTQMMNLVVRRKGSENNFKSVLETIRGLMDGVASISRVMPSWLQLILLGLGDPAAASYKSSTVQSYARRTVGVANPDAALDFGDTFLSEEHLRESFADTGKLVCDGEKEEGRCNYKIRFVEGDSKSGGTQIEATSYSFPEEVTGNPVRFTPPQVEAIRSGLSPGLSLVVGPPGTG